MREGAAAGAARRRAHDAAKLAMQAAAAGTARPKKMMRNARPGDRAGSTEREPGTDAVIKYVYAPAYAHRAHSGASAAFSTFSYSPPARKRASMSRAWRGRSLGTMCPAPFTVRNVKFCVGLPVANVSK